MSLIARTIDHYENLNAHELRTLLDWFFYHWSSESRGEFIRQHPVIYERMNPGSLRGALAAEELRDMLDPNRKD